MPLFPIAVVSTQSKKATFWRWTIEAEKGSTIDFDKVLAVSGDAGLTIGSPHVAGAIVSAEVIGPKLGKKLVIQKIRRRKNSRRKTGHRQMHLEVKIGKISG